MIGAYINKPPTSAVSRHQWRAIKITVGIRVFSAEEKGEKLARYDDTGADQRGHGGRVNEKDRADSLASAVSLAKNAASDAQLHGRAVCSAGLFGVGSSRTLRYCRPVNAKRLIGGETGARCLCRISIPA